jgi:hypothetical protein
MRSSNTAGKLRTPESAKENLMVAMLIASAALLTGGLIGMAIFDLLPTDKAPRSRR